MLLVIKELDLLKFIEFCKDREIDIVNIFY